MANSVRAFGKDLMADASYYKESSGPFSYIIFRDKSKINGLYYLYRIINKILIAAGFTGAENMDCFFLENIPEKLTHDTYAQIYVSVDMLLQAETGEERQEICKEIEELFARDL